MESYDLSSMILAILLSVTGGLIVGSYVRGKFKSEIKNEEKPGVWRTQDWIWLVCFLLYAQVFTVLYKEMVMGVVSYVSTFVSISLGAVAIYISIREVTKRDVINGDMNRMLIILTEKISQMDTKITKLDPRYIEERDKEIDESTEKFKKEVEAMLQKLPSVENLTKEDVIHIVNQQIDKTNSDLKSSLTVVDAKTIGPNKISRHSRFHNELKNKLIDVLFFADHNIEYSLADFRRSIEKNTNISFDTFTLLQIVNDLIEQGVIVKGEGSDFIVNKDFFEK